jgi:hypothetical protein
MGRAMLERYDGRIVGVLSCFDRALVIGTQPTVYHPMGFP